MLRTQHLQLVRGSTLSVTRVARDDNNNPVDLTGAEIYLAMRADIKIDPTVKLTSKAGVAGWRQGIVINDQNTSRGSYTVTFVPADTSALVALGHDDPWIYDVKIKLSSGDILTDVSLSNIDLYPESTVVP